MKQAHTPVRSIATEVTRQTPEFRTGLLVTTFQSLLVQLGSTPAVATAFVAIGDGTQRLVISVVRGEAGQLFLTFPIGCSPMMIDQVAQRHRLAGRGGIDSEPLSRCALPRRPELDDPLTPGQRSPFGQGKNQELGTAARIRGYRVDEFVQALRGQRRMAGSGTKLLDIGPDSGLVTCGHLRMLFRAVVRSHLRCAPIGL